MISRTKAVKSDFWQELAVWFSFGLSGKMKFAIKAALSIALVHLVCFAMGWPEARTAAIAILIIVSGVQPGGSSSNKALFRVIDTLIGATVGLTLIGLFPQDRLAYLASVSIAIMFFAYLSSAYKGGTRIFMLSALTLYQLSEVKKLSHLDHARLVATIEGMQKLHIQLCKLAEKLNSLISPKPTHFALEDIPRRPFFLWFDIENYSTPKVKTVRHQMQNHKKLIKATIATLILSSITIYAGSDHPHEGDNHEGHDHSQKEDNHKSHGHLHRYDDLKNEVSREAIEKTAIQKVQSLVLEKKISATWKDMPISKIGKTHYGDTNDWVVGFYNKRIKNKKRQTLYIFVSVRGEIRGANYTGN